MAGSSLASRGSRWTDSLERYRAGKWRAPIFRDLVLEAIGDVPRPARVVDIGCGRGFDDDLRLQASIAEASGTYIGIEPDPGIPLGPYFQEVHRTLFEEAPIEPGSIDVAFSVMVLEHVTEPTAFWDKLHEVLCEGGVFLGFTMDARHWFCTASAWAGRLGIKDFYLDRVVRKTQEDCYENYPVQYRCNTPGHVAKYAARFSEIDCCNFGRVGQCDYYLPRLLKPLSRMFDRHALAAGRPGTLLAIRACK